MRTAHVDSKLVNPDNPPNDLEVTVDVPGVLQVVIKTVYWRADSVALIASQE